jgi:phosphoribosylglycinamide formyltransferase-1
VSTVEGDEERLRVAILISGAGSNMMTLLQSMASVDHPAAPSIVIANRPDAGGLEKAKAHGVKALCIDHKAFGSRAEFEDALHSALLDATPDLICLAGFMRILSAEFVAKWEGRILNIHPSLLPKYRGLHTHARAIEAEDDLHGCTVHHVTAALDDGPIIGQATVRIASDETPESLAAKVLVQEHQLYPKALRVACESLTQK